MNPTVIQTIFAQLKCKSNRNHHGVLLYNQIAINHKITTGMNHHFNINIERNKHKKKHTNIIDCLIDIL